jgi:hypothetical protein
MTSSITFEQASWLLLRAASSYQREFSAAAPHMWFERFNGYEFGELRSALDSHIDTSPHFPTVADLANLANPARRQREAVERRRAAFVEEFEDNWSFVQVLARDDRLDRDVAWARWTQGDLQWWQKLKADAKAKNYVIAHRVNEENGWSLRP